MDMDYARRLLEKALNSGLKLHGISATGRPAISFDPDQPGSELARRRFLSTEGYIRELLRAAMIEECQRRGLPQGLPVDNATAAGQAAPEPGTTIH